jgi:DNA-binding CsgD family transcriptional regulator
MLSRKKSPAGKSRSVASRAASHLSRSATSGRTKPKRKPRVATFNTAQEPPRKLLSDLQMLRNYLSSHPGPLNRLNAQTSHVAIVYREARVRREYRQAHVMMNWDQTDRRILFLLVLGYSRKAMQYELGISRQAVEKRLDRMCRQVGVEAHSQLLLWILGFVSLYPDGKMSTTGTTLLEAHDHSTPFGRSVFSSIRVSTESLNEG